MGKSHQERNKKMLEITENNPKEKEIRDAIKYLSGLLEKNREIEKSNIPKMTMEDIIKKQKERLDGQGKDIFILWSKIENLERRVFKII